MKNLFPPHFVFFFGGPRPINAPSGSSEIPKSASESFKDKSPLNYTGFDGESVIGEQKKYTDPERPINKAWSDAVIDIVIQSQVKLNKTDKARGADVKKNQKKYMNTITNHLLKVTTEICHPGDKLSMKDSIVTVSLKEKDGTFNEYKIDISKPTAEIATQAMKESDIQRNRVSLDILDLELQRDKQVLPAEVQKGLRYMRIFKSPSIQQIMESLDMAPTAGYAFRANYWKEKMGKTDNYDATPKQNMEMKQHLKKAVYSTLGMTETDIVKAADIFMEFNTLKTKLNVKYGVKGEDLPKDRGELSKVKSVQNSMEAAAKSGLDQTKIGQEIQKLQVEILEEAITTIILNYKYPELDAKLKVYHNYADPIEIDAQPLQDRIDALILDKDIRNLFTEGLHKIIDTHRLRIAGEYVDVAKIKIDAEPDNVIKDEGYFLGLPEVTEAKNAIGKVDARKGVEKTALEQQIFDVIDAQMIVVAEAKFRDAESKINAQPDNVIKPESYFDGLSEVTEAVNARNVLTSRPAAATKKTELENKLNDVKDEKIVKIAENQLVIAKIEISRVTEWTKTVPDYHLLLTVKEASDAINNLRAAGRRGTYVLGLVGDLSAAIDTQRHGNIDTHLKSPVFQATINTIVTVKTTPVADYKMKSGIKEVSDAIKTLANQGTLMADLEKLIQDKINTLPNPTPIPTPTP